MKTYVMTTGTLFGLLVAVHIWRILEEVHGLMKDPWYVGSTIIATALCVWAWRLIRLMPRS
jgi:hypothetical protein